MEKTLYTIGYEGSTIDEVLSTLTDAEVDCVIDVRQIAISRKAGFSKSALSSQLASRGIHYTHLKGLGDPKPGRTAAREGRFGDFRRIFEAHLASDIAQTDLQRGLEIAEARIACLLCYERDATHCHRLVVAEEMVRHHQFQLVNLDTKSRLMVRSPKGYPHHYDRPNAYIG